MNSPFGEVFMFLTNLAWKSRVTIPVLVTTAFLIMDIRLQIEINIQSGQADAAKFNQIDGDNNDDYLDVYEDAIFIAAFNRAAAEFNQIDDDDDDYLDSNDDDDDDYAYEEYTTDSNADDDEDSEN